MCEMLGVDWKGGGQDGNVGVDGVAEPSFGTPDFETGRTFKHSPVGFLKVFSSKLPPPNQPRRPRNWHRRQPHQPHRTPSNPNRIQPRQHRRANQRAGNLRERNCHIVQPLDARHAGSHMGEFGVDQRERNPHCHSPGCADEGEEDEGDCGGLEGDCEEEGGGCEELGDQPEAREVAGVKDGVDAGEAGQEDGGQEGS
ncbi:hypothetical protein CORC01_07565 [Colletotrichum orchidophilum]|uniref:Uncharacterized protein n=1 Tax=Colletotrichum orchidophilum TaxID=1209926 RepID=A0A1G4B6V4_9PEZI|nr:uncharacterized protein CORC01_07565 [Colletotrichum orchidophilum]OHE97124.1 hypothetical protein CORC01_07565 [Colletotrichum orchidophilum]